MITCSKTYTDIPFAHRQHRHRGHCSMIHGHNWTIELTFACDEFDENGFVVDFGNLKYIKAWIAEHLAHAGILAADDPLKDDIINSVPEVYRLHEVPNASCEGISTHIWEAFSRLLCQREGRRVWISQVRLWEDSKNMTTYTVPESAARKLQAELEVGSRVNAFADSPARDGALADGVSI